jgi:hypothetical protein
MKQNLEDTATWKFYSGVSQLGNIVTRMSQNTSYSAKLTSITNPGFVGNIWFGFIMLLANLGGVGLIFSYFMMRTFKRFGRTGLVILIGWSFIGGACLWTYLLISGFFELLPPSIVPFVAWLMVILVVILIMLPILEKLGLLKRFNEFLKRTNLKLDKFNKKNSKK